MFLHDCLEGKEINLSFADKKAVCFVMTSGGYPGNYETGYEITGITQGKRQRSTFCRCRNRTWQDCYHRR